MLHRALFVISLLRVLNAEDKIAEDTLALVHIVIRHGHRTPDPLSTFPTDVYKNLTYYPYGAAELNKIGIENSFVIGKQLRNRYDKFLGEKYCPESVEAISSGFPRCRMTLQILLAAMFPPHQSQLFQEGLPWQPIAYQYHEPANDNLLGFLQHMQYFKSQQPIKSLDLCENRQFMYEYLSEHTGFEVNSSLLMSFLNDNFKSQEENGLILPDWIKPIWKEPMNTCAFEVWKHFTNNKSALATAGGVFIKKIISDTTEKIRSNLTLKTKKIIIYSGHDFNIYVLLGMLEYYTKTVINYLAYILLEVHKIGDVYGFKVYLENHDGNGLKQLEIPRCGLFCPVNRFKELMEFYWQV